MSLGWLFLIIAVAGSTLVWPLGRWGLAGEGRAMAMGFWTSLTMGVVSLIAWIFAGEPTIPGQVWVSAALLAVSYAVGFCTLIMHCLKIGPAGPTVTVNNLAMACGVVYDVMYLRPTGAPPAQMLAGAAGTCVALVLIGLGSGGAARPVSRRWLPMLIAGGAFSGLSFIVQTHIGATQRQHRFAFLCIASFLSAAMLMPTVLGFSRTPSSERERLAGVGIGFVSGIGMLVALAAYRHFPAAVVLPVTVVTPLVFVLIFGHFLYAEKLNRLTLAGVLTAMASLVMLSLACE